jgi:hypothetical protein
VNTFLDQSSRLRPHPISYSYIEEFWYESYLSHSDPVVLALNPFFVLEYISDRSPTSPSNRSWVGTTLRQTEALKSPVQPHLSSLLWDLSMTSAVES